MGRVRPGVELGESLAAPSHLEDAWLDQGRGSSADTRVFRCETLQKDGSWCFLVKGGEAPLDQGPLSFRMQLVEPKQLGGLSHALTF